MWICNILLKYYFLIYDQTSYLWGIWTTDVTRNIQNIHFSQIICKDCYIKQLTRLKHSLYYIEFVAISNQFYFYFLLFSTFYASLHESAWILILTSSTLWISGFMVFNDCTIFFICLLLWLFHLPFLLVCLGWSQLILMESSRSTRVLKGLSKRLHYIFPAIFQPVLSFGISDKWSGVLVVYTSFLLSSWGYVLTFVTNQKTTYAQLKHKALIAPHHSLDMAIIFHDNEVGTYIVSYRWV